MQAYMQAFADVIKSPGDARRRVGDAAVVIGGVAPLVSFPALPWPLRTILGWRSAALQAAAERLTGRLPRLVVERFSAPLGPDLFASDGFHPNLQAHTLWGEEIAALALPLIAGADHSPSRRSTVRMSTSEVSVRCTGHLSAISNNRRR